MAEVPANRTPEQVRRHYEVERELADRLRNASRDERRSLYVSLYDELFRRLPDHPMLSESAADASAHVAGQMRFLRPLLKPDATLLEVGPGKCEVLLEAARYVRRVVGVDVARELTKNPDAPNFELMISDGCTIPVPEGSVTIAYSHQLMEHLHPADAFEQIGNIYRALAPGGVYVCITPNGLSGPHDVSKYFDRTATGFHLKEYTNRELGALFRKAGFSKVTPYAGVKGRTFAVPLWVVACCEALLGALPWRLRKWLAGHLPMRALLGIRLIATK